MAHLYEVDTNAQRLVVEALGQRNFQTGRHVLCHAASDIYSNNGLLVTTHDRLYELLSHRQVDVTSVFPNVSYIRRMCKDIKEDFRFEIVLACHSTSDPVDVVIEILGKFSNDFFSLKSVEYLVELPPGTYWKKSSSIAYVVSISNAIQDDLNLFWKNRVNNHKEVLLPKAIVWRHQRYPRCLMIKEDHWPVKHFRGTAVKRSAMRVMLSQLPSKLQPETREGMQRL